jgi:hypothetical protein
VARILPLLDRPGLQEWDVNLLLPRLAGAYLALGDLAQTERVVQPALGRLRAQWSQLWLVDALGVQGQLLARRQQVEEAGQAYDEALTLARGMGYRGARGGSCTRTVCCRSSGKSRRRSPLCSVLQ